jgi:hypothetical protein
VINIMMSDAALGQLHGPTDFAVMELDRQV